MIQHMTGNLVTSLALLAAAVPVAGAPGPGPAEPPEPVRRLAEEVRGKGWIVFSARSGKGDWDLFACRPDGADVRNITRTPAHNEAMPRVSRDGRRLLYRRLRRNETIHNNRHGAQGELVLANADGTKAQPFGRSGQYPWASWGPDGRQIACLSIQGVSFVDVATQRVVRTLKRRGFFQQLTWSPDGKWLCGVANSFGTSWSVARMNVATGAANAVSRIQCCTPDWFPDSRRLIYSNRPPGQKANKGYGWTRLWMADRDGTRRRLVYGEDGRHVYGGCVSPDGKHVLFTGNLRENGDPARAGAPMGLMRLSDAPIVAGRSQALRKAHPGARSGPLLVLPAGWEPFWTAAEIFAGGPDSAPERPPARDDAAHLAAEVRGKGWIVFSAPTGRGDWDLFLLRPDGADRRRITDTRDHNEAGGRFSPDGRKLLYHRMPKTEAVDNNSYGRHELVVADADGRGSVVYGKGFDWASWSPRGDRIACLDTKGIRIVDLASRRTVRRLPRRGIVQQLQWSPDGRWLVGTANGLGQFWTIGRLDAAGERINAVSETDRYNCTPDWAPDSRRVVYSRGIVPDKGGWAQLWAAGGGGRDRRLVYAEDGRHVYGACLSPDGKYVLFTRSEADLGKVDNSRTSMALIRWSDAPMVGGPGEALRKAHPDARSGPLLVLPAGWEPHWTYADVGARPGEGAGARPAGGGRRLP